jgi:hypothetical protein
MDHTGRVEDGRRADGVEQPVDACWVPHVADDGLDRRAHDLEERRLFAVVHEAADAFALAGEGPHQVLAEPARGSRDDGDAGSFRVGSHRNCLADRHPRGTTDGARCRRAPGPAVAERPVDGIDEGVPRSLTPRPWPCLFIE